MSRMERKRERLEIEDLEVDILERKQFIRLQIMEVEMKWRYHLQFLDVLKEKNAAYNLHELKLKRIQVLQELANLEGMRLRGLDAALERQRTEQLLEQSNNRLQEMYQQLNDNDSDLVT